MGALSLKRPKEEALKTMTIISNSSQYTSSTWCANYQETSEVNMTKLADQKNQN
jgi:hypothetical protein